MFHLYKVQRYLLPFNMVYVQTSTRFNPFVPLFLKKLLLSLSEMNSNKYFAMPWRYIKFTKIDFNTNNPDVYVNALYIHLHLIFTSKFGAASSIAISGCETWCSLSNYNFFLSIRNRCL